MYTGDRGTLLTFPLMCFYGKIRIRLMLVFSPFFGGDDLAGATALFMSATLVVVPTDRETDGTDLLLTGAAGRCFLVTG